MNFLKSLVPDQKRKGASLQDSPEFCHEDIKLVMTLVCRDEIDLIERNIRFHLAMGVDGIIVTDHRSTDGTRELLGELKQQGLVLDVIHQDCKEHLRSAFVLEMIDLAKSKYEADWIINADVDEFYYAESLNLKSDISKFASVANVLKVYSNFVSPDGREDFLSCVYFCKRGLTDYDYDFYGIEKNDITDYWEANACPKSIHNTKDFVSLSDGNHFVKMAKHAEAEPSNITLYHYHTRNYESLERKAIKAMPTIAAFTNPDVGRGWKRIAKLYKEDNLRRYYDERFGEKVFERLIEIGCVCKDPSVFNFMQRKGII